MADAEASLVLGVDAVDTKDDISSTVLRRIPENDRNMASVAAVWALTGSPRLTQPSTTMSGPRSQSSTSASTLYVSITAVLEFALATKLNCHYLEMTIARHEQTYPWYWLILISLERPLYFSPRSILTCVCSREYLFISILAYNLMRLKQDHIKWDARPTASDSANAAT